MKSVSGQVEFIVLRWKAEKSDSSSDSTYWLSQQMSLQNQEKVVPCIEHLKTVHTMGPRVGLVYANNGGYLVFNIPVLSLRIMC